MQLNLISSFVFQDLQEMIWIETQASTLMIIAFLLLCLWPVAEYYRYNVQVKKENRFRYGMNYLFSVKNDTK